MDYMVCYCDETVSTPHIECEQKEGVRVTDGGFTVPLPRSLSDIVTDRDHVWFAKGITVGLGIWIVMESIQILVRT